MQDGHLTTFLSTELGLQYKHYIRIFTVQTDTQCMHVCHACTDAGTHKLDELNWF